MQYLLKLLGEIEEANFVNENKIRENLSVKFSKLKLNTEETYLNLPILDREKEIYINPGEVGWEYRYYNQLLNMERTEENIKKVVSNYFTGLEWTLKYYKVGCINWDWCYKYNYPPLLIDLYKFSPYFNISFIKPVKSIPLEPEVQLAYVLPNNSHHYIDKKLLDNLKKSNIELGCKNMSIEYSYCRYMWEGHIEVDGLSVEQLKNIIALNK